MKKFLSVLISILLLASVACLCACAADGKTPSFFMFASVRIKGNGDGTVTAVAQNEFSVGDPNVPVTLTLYRGDNYTADISQMQPLKSERSDGLSFWQTLRITADVDEGYYCAVLEYAVNDEYKTIQSDTVHYNGNGKRIQ